MNEINSIIKILPPVIKKYYDNLLLSGEFKLCDNLEILHKIYIRIKKESEKFRNYPNEWNRWEKLEKLYLDLYERAKNKKEKCNKKTKNRTEEPFYYIRMPDKRSECLFIRLKFRR